MIAVDLVPELAAARDLGAERSPDARGAGRALGEERAWVPLPAPGAPSRIATFIARRSAD